MLVALRRLILFLALNHPAENLKVAYFWEQLSGSELEPVSLAELRAVHGGLALRYLVMFLELFSIFFSVHRRTVLVLSWWRLFL